MNTFTRFLTALTVLFGLLFSTIAIIGCGSDNIKQVADPETQFKRAMELYEKGKYYKAETEFQMFIYNYPGNTSVDSAQYLLAMCYYKDRDYAIGAGEFKKFLTSFPTSPFADDSQYRLALCHYHQSPHYALDQMDTYIAIDEFYTFLDDYPKSELEDSVSMYLNEMRNKLAKKSFRTAKMYQGFNLFDPAILYYNKILKEYSDSQFSSEALFRRSECHFKLDKPLEAREDLLEYIDRYKGEKYYNKATKRLREIEDNTRTEK
ncbi:MAG: outer membrane protein assembly factor BamD [candidate division Zixibacteria bacterium]|nr:outer membrane protein assembly factor BamD [candidate division Zixibacteria bacterium]